MAATSLDISALGPRQFDEGLLLAQAWCVNLSCRQSRFRNFDRVVVDGTIDSNGITKTGDMINVLNQQLAAGSSRTAITPHIFGFLRNALGSNVDSLQARCRTSNPNPPTPDPTPDPDPTPPDPTPPPEPPKDRPAGFARIVVANQSSQSSTEIMKWVDDCKWQMDNHVAPNYGYVEIKFGLPETKDDWPIVVLDKSTIDGAGGWHSVGGVNGDSFEPIGEVSLNSGLPPSLVLSHEVCEMVGNQSVSQWCQYSGDWMIARELNDPVQSPGSGYNGPRGSLLSDFVLPDYWGDYGEVANDYTARGKYYNRPTLTGPLSIAPSGYAIMMNKKTGAIEYVFGSKTHGREVSEIMDVLNATGPEADIRAARSAEMAQTIGLPGGILTRFCQLRHSRMRADLLLEL